MFVDFTPKEIERMSQGLAPWESMSFACGGWLQFYMFGVGKALQVSGLDKGVVYCGCSAGALAAAGLALQGSFDDGVQYCKDDAVPTAYASVANLFKLEDYVGGSADRCLVPHFDQEKLKNLQMSVTKLPFFTKERITTYTSRADLKSALLASCAAFPVSKLEYRNGAYYIDGGFTDFQPIIDENTITVSPFYFSDCDIKPSRYVPLWWAFLPPNHNDTMDWLYGLGYEDTMNYIKKRGILEHVQRAHAAANSTIATTSESTTESTNSSTADCDQNGETTPTALQNSNTARQAAPLLAGSATKHQRTTLQSLLHNVSVACRLKRRKSVPHPYDTPRTVR